jgi:hypothetical protein
LAKIQQWRKKPKGLIEQMTLYFSQQDQFHHHEQITLNKVLLQRLDEWGFSESQKDKIISELKEKLGKIT